MVRQTPDLLTVLDSTLAPMAAYDAFFSYSHAEDRGVARQLQVGVEKFAKPWYRIRAQRVFLDTNSLSADPRLWSSVEHALAGSSWFVLIASPLAAASPWVEREIRWWLENRSADRLLIVVADGALRWDPAKGDFDAAASTALPPALLGVLDEEPRWVTVPPGAAGNPGATDLDLRETVIDIATTLRGIPKEELVGVAAREHKRTMRWVRGTIAVLAALLVTALIAGLVALSQRATATDQARIAVSRQIASASREAAGRNLSTSMLLAVEAYKHDPNAQTRAALFAANTASPHLEQFLDAGGKVERLQGTPDGVVVAGLADGRVILWPEGEGEPRELLQLQRPVSSLAISRDGTAVAAADGDQGLIWQEEQDLVRLPAPLEQHVDAVALSPSGRTLAYHAESPDDEERQSVTVASTTGPTVRPLGRFGTESASTLVLPSDERLLISDIVSWQWRRISDLSLLGSSTGYFGAHAYAPAYSADGQFFTMTNGAKTIPVWSTEETDLELDESDLGVESPVADQSALALSPDGEKIAVAGSEGIYVASVTAAQERSFEAVESTDPAFDQVQLTGQVRVDEGLLVFAGDDSKLLSASGSEIAIWDLEQVDRLARRTVVPLEFSCTACEGASIAVSPDGKRIAVTGGYGQTAFVQDLQGDLERTLLPEPDFGEHSYGSPVWQGNGEFVVYPVELSEFAPDAPLPTGVPDDVRIWTEAALGIHDTSTPGAASAAISASGEAVMLVGSDGDVYWQDAETGDLLKDSPRPDPLGVYESLEDATLNSSPELLATIDQGEVILEDLPERSVVGSFEVGKFARLSFAGDRLLVQRRDGALEVWDQRGNNLQRTIPGDNTFDGPPVGNAADSLVARRRSDGSVVLVDVESGAQLATFEAREASSLKTSVAFSPNGEDLYVLSEVLGEGPGGELLHRNISDAAGIETACDSAGRDLTESEWRAFIGIEAPSDLSCP